VGIYDQTYPEIFVSVNGRLSFLEGNYAWEHGTLPDVTLPPYSILPYYGTFVILENEDNYINYEIQGVTGSRRLIIEWRVTGYDDQGEWPVSNFAAVFYENRPRSVDFVYYDMPDAGRTATTGFQNLLTGTRFQEISFNEAVINSQTFMRITTTATGAVINSNLISAYTCPP
jgi:hypothetical protein